MAVISGTGLKQGDLVDFLSATMTLVNELRSDHATFKSAISALGSKVQSITVALSQVTSIATSQPLSVAAMDAAPATLTAAAVTFTI